MIRVEDYLRFCDEALDGYAGIVTALGDDLVNARLTGIPGSNSAFALVTHIEGMTARWARTVNRAVVVPRDRDAEFSATGTAAQALASVERTRSLLHDDASAAAPTEPPANPAHEKDGTLSYATQGEVLLHVYEELAQHLGQLEVTRDVLLAGRSVDPDRGGAGTGPGARAGSA